MHDKKSPAREMNVKVIGSGETTLVLAHGFGANQFVWDRLIPEISRNHRVVVFDWCFCSSIEKNSIFAFDEKRHSSYEAFSDDLITLADDMNIRDAVCIGHSMSSMIGCIVSIKRPDIFRHLLLIGASPRFLNSEDFRGGFDREEVEKIFTNIESNFHEWASNFAGLAVDAQDPISTQKFGNMLQSMRPEVALSLAKTVFLCDNRQILDQVEIPTTIIQCSNDIFVPMPVAEYMHQKMKRKAKATLEVIEANGHYPQLTVSKSLLEIFERVLGSADGTSSPIKTVDTGALLDSNQQAAKSVMET